MLVFQTLHAAENWRNNRAICVRNLHEGACELYLRLICSPHGPIESIKIYQGSSGPFGIVTYCNEDEDYYSGADCALNAIEKLHGATEVSGIPLPKTLFVTLAH